MVGLATFGLHNPVFGTGLDQSFGERDAKVRLEQFILRMATKESRISLSEKSYKRKSDMLLKELKELEGTETKNRNNRSDSEIMVVDNAYMQRIKQKWISLPFPQLNTTNPRPLYL